MYFPKYISSIPIITITSPNKCIEAMDFIRNMHNIIGWRETKYFNRLECLYHVGYASLVFIGPLLSRVLFGSCRVLLGRICRTVSLVNYGYGLCSQTLKTYLQLRELLDFSTAGPCRLPAYMNSRKTIFCKIEK